MATSTDKTHEQPQTGRTSWEVARSVWSALFVREFLARLMADRLAWFWMIVEPIAFVAIMIAVRVVVLGQNAQIAGAEFVPWMITGLMGFFLFRENMQRPIGAIEANQGLFAYRQVKPVDPVLVRCYLEGMTRSVLMLLFIAVAALIQIDLVPERPVMAIGGWLSLWALGIGAGLTLSALSALVPEIAKLVRIVSLPLLILSNVIAPLHLLPHDLLVYLMYNPIVHGIEYMRMGFFPYYHALPGTDITYLWYWALGLMALGLMLHLRFEMRLKAK
ncbi:ABC transporter permease [Guyparkeria hydrothermalis]|uniref:ABC transporter permease n=1 Tax=Guyparkeria hydrothermalis TaxID=923 RepID=UPI00202013BC|nr:ABC transporter permease [Guyparkeria hydrothermalis]MCL7745469.1 ABC transporter permease [Guyparkeria hydrothermalis]